MAAAAEARAAAPNSSSSQATQRQASQAKSPSLPVFTNFLLSVDNIVARTRTRIIMSSSTSFAHHHHPTAASLSLGDDNNPYNLKQGELSSGTTIVAVPIGTKENGGVVLAADSRVTTGAYIANRVSDKLVQLAPHIYAARSGSAADTQAVTDYVKYYVQQLSIETGRPAKVYTAAHLMQSICYGNKDHLSAGLIVAGWDPVDGSSVYQITQGGSLLKVPFAVGGSGGTYIYGWMDSNYKEGMTKDEARQYVKTAVAHAMARDGSSGGVIRTVAITSDGVVDRDYTPGDQLPFGPTGY